MAGKGFPDRVEGPAASRAILSFMQSAKSNFIFLVLLHICHCAAQTIERPTRFK